MLLTSGWFVTVDDEKIQFAVNTMVMVQRNNRFFKYINRLVRVNHF